MVLTCYNHHKAKAFTSPLFPNFTTAAVDLQRLRQVHEPLLGLR